MSFRLAAALALTILLTSALPALAQPEATAPPADERGDRRLNPPVRLDLAAMALDSTDVPPEFNLFYEAYLPGNELSDLLLQGLLSQEEINATGLRWFYESVYSTPSGSTRLRSYIEEYPSEDGAIAGFALLEDEERLLEDTSLLSDEPGPGIGEEPSEITSGSFTTVNGEAASRTLDLTFRVGRLLAGVSMDTSVDIDPDRQLVLQMAERLEQRIVDVLDGTPIPLIDPALPSQVITAPELYDVRQGYLSASEYFGPEVGPTVEDMFVSSYSRLASPARMSAGEPPIPSIGNAVSRFTSEAGPLALLDQLDLLQPVNPNVERVTLDRIPGADVALGYRFANMIFTGAESDSFRVVMMVATDFVVIDVQGSSSAEQTAIAVAIAQAGCLRGSTDCTVPTLPEDVFTRTVATPVPDPVG